MHESDAHGRGWYTRAPMCGIAGVVLREGRKPSEAALSAMGMTMKHRGPDGSGVAVFAGAGLSHRRLAIIDLTEAASQPLALPDGSASICFNGEIFNFREVREELARRGWSFRSTGDTEVALAAYREFGESFLERLEGQFAISIWDEREKKLLLGRDRTGEKPLYVYRDAEKFLFASEIKALLAYPGVDAALDPAAVPLYLAYGYVPTPGTHFSKIRQLPPATRLIVDVELRERETRFWDYPVGGEEHADDVETACTRIRDLFRDSVKHRMISDVPVGAFLSGGIDSTLVVGAMSEVSTHPVRTFAIGFKDAPSHDETPFARAVAKRFHTEHTEFQVDFSFFDLIEDLARQFDQPFGDSSAIPTYVVSKLTRQHVTVALTGDGGDELFSGYPRFRKAMRMERVPRGLARGLDAAARRLPGKKHSSPMGKLKRSLARTALSPAARIRSWAGFFGDAELAEALSPDLLPGAIDASYDHELAAAAAADPLNRLLYLNAKTYLPDDLLPKVDRMSMAVSLETRAPFLDTALIEYVFRLPGRYKQHGRTSKWILKRAFRDLLPPEIEKRPKKGFVVPLGPWFRGPLAARVDALLEKNANIYPMLRREFVARIAREHRDGTRDWGQHIWLLWMLEHFLAGRHGSRA